MSYGGGCICGRVRYEVRGDALHRSFCHCESCRRAIGAPMVPWVTFALENFAMLQGRLAEYRSSPGVTRGFCADCGTSLTYRHEQRAGEIDLTLSSVDQPHALAPLMHIWVEDKPSWVVIADGLPQFAKVPGRP